MPGADGEDILGLAPDVGHLEVDVGQDRRLGNGQVTGKIVRTEQALLLGRHRRENQVGLEGFGPLGVIGGQGQHGSRRRAIVHGAVINLVPGKSSSFPRWSWWAEMMM